MPATLADPKRSLDSEQISPATIAHHTVYEKTPNLHQSHICQWGAQPYLVGPLSRLVGKPPLSPWLLENVLPLTQAGNDPNSAISLSEIFDRILFDVRNSLDFGVQKAKNGDRGTIVFTATLTSKKTCIPGYTTTASRPNLTSPAVTNNVKYWTPFYTTYYRPDHFYTAFSRTTQKKVFYFMPL